MSTPFHIVSLPFPGIEDVPGLNDWLYDNIKGKYGVMSSVYGAPITLWIKEVTNINNVRCVWLFSELDDALLFKLTWGGANAG